MLLPFLFLLSFYRFASADEWFTPPGNDQNKAQETWYLGETKELIWQTDLSAYSIYLQQNLVSASTGLAIVLGKESAMNPFTHLNWTVQSYHFDLTIPTPFYFIISDAKGNMTTSAYFQISPTYQTTTQNATFVCPTNNGTATSLQSDQASLHQQAKTIGVALGLGLGLPLIIALGFIAFLMTPAQRVKRVKVEDTKNEAHKMMAEAPSQFTYHEVSDQVEVHEAPDGNMLHQK